MQLVKFLVNQSDRNFFHYAIVRFSKAGIHEKLQNFFLWEGGGRGRHIAVPFIIVIPEYAVDIYGLQSREIMRLVASVGLWNL